MSIQTAETKIINILSTVSGITVFDHEPKDFLTLPAVTVQYNQVEQRRFRFGKRLATYTFFLRLYVGMGTSEQSSFETFKTLTDQIIAAFNAKPEADLQQSVLAQDITFGSLDVEIDVQKPRYINTFTLTIQEEV